MTQIVSYKLCHCRQQSPVIPMCHIYSHPFLVPCDFLLQFLYTTIGKINWIFHSLVRNCKPSCQEEFECRSM